VAFSLSGSKREIYLLPLFPFAAIVVARFLERAGAGLRWPVAVLGGAVGAAAAAAVGALGWAIGRFGKGMDPAPLEGAVRLPLAWTCGVLLVPALLAIFWRRRGPAPYAFLLAAFLATAAIPIHQRLFPALNPFVSARGAAELLRAHARPGERLLQYRLDDMGLVYYAGRPMEIQRSSTAHVCDLFAGDRPVLCLTTAEGLRRVRDAVAPDPLAELARTAVGSKRDLVLVRWDPSP
jgi:hypothetical protein